MRLSPYRMATTADASASREPRPLSPAPLAAATDGARANVWRWPLLTFALAFVALCALFAGTVSGMVEKWWSVETYGHGFLILPISAYLMWRRRREFAQIQPRPSVLGLVALLGAALVWLVGDVTSARVVEQAGLVMMIQALFLAVFGWRVTRAALFPLLFLVFAVPFGDFLVPTLQRITADYAVWLLRLSGIPVYVEDLYIHIPSGSFVVAEACAGLRFMISTVVIGFLGAYLFYWTWWRRLLFLALSFAVPVVANILRAYLIIMIAYWSDHRLAVGADHLIYGWVFLSFVTLSLIGLGLLFRDRSGRKATPAAETPSLPLRALPKGRFVAAGLAAVVIAAAAPAYSAWTQPPAFASGQRALPALPVGAPWQAGEGNGRWRAVFPGAAGEGLWRYQKDGMRVDAFVAVYPWQRDGAELINTGNQLGERPTWRPTGGGTVGVAAGGKPVTLATQRLQDGVNKRLVWYGYWLDGRFTASPQWVKLLEAKTRLLHRDQGAAVVVLSAPYAETPAEAERALRDFLAHVPDLGGYLASIATGGAATPGPVAPPPATGG